MPAGIAATLEGEKLTVNKLDASRKTYQLHGLSRSLINNMVVGVVGGFEKKMTLVRNATKIIPISHVSCFVSLCVLFPHKP